MTAEFIVVHNTANDASANNEISYMRTNNNKVSFHFAVDDKEVVQGLPLNRNGWHAGDGSNGKGNRKGIGIEICYSKSGGANFVKAEKNAAKFIAQLLKERGWGIDKVKKHQDFSGKYCPHRTLDMGWQRFLNMVKAEMSDPKPVWVDMDKPRRMVAPNAIWLVDLITRKNVAIFKSGTEFDLNQKTEYNGEIYVRTPYSTSKNIDNGFLFNQLRELLVVSPPVEPTPEPQPKPDPDPPVEPEQPEVPITPPIDPKPDPEGFKRFVNWLFDLIKRIFGKE